MSQERIRQAKEYLSQLRESRTVDIDIGKNKHKNGVFDPNETQEIPTSQVIFNKTRDFIDSKISRIYTDTVLENRLHRDEGN